tara:strand:- start:220 stop:534 length:315 start_codon:yes stop_codon:yes gene_type:complete
MKITRRQLRRIIKEAVESIELESKPFKIPYRSVGYAGRRITDRDRAWLEFVPKGSPALTPEDMFRAVTLLDINDPEILKALRRENLAAPIENYDVYSVYATTTG